jgi:hypothetical protein
MGFFRERWEALKEGLGVRRFLYAGFALLVVRFTAWFNQVLMERGMPGFLDIPEWAIWLLVLFGFVAFFVTEYAVKLRRQLAPKLAVSFAPERGCVVTTPIKEQTTEISNSGMKNIRTVERRQVEIRALVTANSEMAVKDCVPYLTGVRKKDPASGVFLQTNYLDDLQLRWHMDSPGAITIPKDVRRYFTIVHIDEKVMQPRIATEWPLTIRNLFDDKTTYQLDLIVRGEGISTRQQIEFTWDGKLENVTGRQL